jgi:hypothetical protein
MNLNLIKQQNGSFLPAYPSDYENAKKIKVGDEQQFTCKKIRSTQFHRLYFALIRLMFEFQNQIKDEYTFRKYVEMKSGYYTITETEHGTMILPKSIAFDKLDAIEFGELYDRVKDFAWDQYALSDDNIEQQLIDFM